MLVGEPPARLVDQRLPFIVQLPCNSEREVFALPLQLALAPTHGELLLTCLDQPTRLLGHLIAQQSDVRPSAARFLAASARTGEVTIHRLVMLPLAIPVRTAYHYQVRWKTALAVARAKSRIESCSLASPAT